MPKKREQIPEQVDQSFHERYEYFLNQMLDGEATASDIQELQSLLKGDDDLATNASDRLAEHRLLGMLHQDFDSEAFGNSVMESLTDSDARTVDSIINQASESGNRDSANPKLSTNQMWFGFVMLAALLLFGVSLYGPRERATDESVAKGTSLPPDVATLLLAENCQWASANASEGERLPKGNVILQSGLAVIRFDGGAEVVLQDDCSLDLLSAGSVQVNHGNIIVRATDQATGFRVQTPSSELIDLGTEFSVSVEQTGQTKLNVLEGEVSIRPRKFKTNQLSLLTQGNSVLVKDGSSPPTVTQHDSLRFASVIQKAELRSRPNLRYAYEGFFYDEGRLPLAASTAGTGWVGPWRKRTPAEGYVAQQVAGNSLNQDIADSLSIVHGKMNVTWGVRGGQLGMLEMPAGKIVRLRQMKRSIDLSQDGVYYFSLMVYEPDHSQRDPATLPKERVRLTMRSEADYYGEALSFGIAGHSKPRILIGNGIGFVSSAQTPFNQTTLWIGKIIARAEGIDEVYFRVFSEDEELFSDQWNWAEPAQWDVASRNLQLSAKLNLAVLTSEGISSRYIDELRIGPTWRSVAPLRP